MNKTIKLTIIIKNVLTLMIVYITLFLSQVDKAIKFGDKVAENSHTMLFSKAVNVRIK